MMKNSFNLLVPLTKNNQQSILNPNGTLDIEGIASTTNRDLHKDIILPSAIASMKEQLLTTSKNLHGDHRYGLFDGLLGSINTVVDSDENTLRIGGTILSKYAKDILEMLDIGVNLGLSIGGDPTEYDIDQDGGWKIKDIRLYEISLTSMPANMDTLGTVTTKGIVEGQCLTGVCHQVMKNLQKEEERILMSENNGSNQQNQEDNVDEKIKAAVNELWAEKEQGLVESVTTAVSEKVKDIVKEEVEKLDNNNGDEGNTESNPDDSSAQGTSEKGLSSEEMADMVNKSITESFTQFKKQFFETLENNRNPQSNVDLQKQEQLLNEETQSSSNGVPTFSTEDTAKILMEKQRNSNSIMNAVMKNLE